MRKFLCMLSVSVLLLLGSAAVSLSAPALYVDAAPNVYGSSDWTPWLNATYAAVANGTFQNMSNGINPANVGTNDFEIQDEVVYTFGDLGNRLTWIYWIAGETKESLLNKNFGISLTNTWDGVAQDIYEHYYGSTWITPGRWQDYDSNGDGVIDGVIGTAGMAWVGGQDTNTQEELDADILSWAAVPESYVFSVKYDDSEGNSLTVTRAPTPEPSTMLLLGIGVLGLAGAARKRHLKK